jgi:hypothetical protein
MPKDLGAVCILGVASNNGRDEVLDEQCPGKREVAYNCTKV